MFWAIVILLVSAAMFLHAGLFFGFWVKDGEARGEAFMLFGIACVIGVFGTIIIFFSGMGNICAPVAMPNQIYAVSGQIETSGGTVAIIEDSKQNVFAVWSKTETLPGLPENAKFVKIAGYNNKKCLVPIETKGVIIPNPLAEKSIAK